MTSFKEMCDDLLDAYHKKEINNIHNITSKVCKEFNIVPHTFRRRFKSIYGDTLGNVLKKLEVPPKDIVTCAILKSKNTKELWEIVKIPNGRRRKLFQELYGVSTFERAKAKLLLETVFSVPYNPSIDENKSLVISQVLGDGSYDKVRGSIRISHGEHQFEYTVWKASMFNKAFPKTKPSGNTKFLVHSQGHKYSSWYSGRLPSKITKYIEATKQCDMVNDLTPLGMFIYTLDDAYINLDLTEQGVKSNNNYLNMYIHDADTLKSIVDYFQTYGISVLVRGSYIEIKDVINMVKFYKNFIEPFKNMVSEDIKYKTILKI